MVAMATVVAAVLYCPLAIALALLLAAFGVPLHAFVTFGGALNLYVGMLAWWLGAFALALAHAGLAFPWAHSRPFHAPLNK